MLHEVLLALSGHPSPLFVDDGQKHSDEISALLSDSEKALLHSIGELANQHRKLRRLIQHIASKHASIICRAVATSIQQTHLSRFQKKILSVEAQILTKDAAMVGAYDIVPLATVVGEFDGWHRLMNWFWELACFIQPSADSSSTTGAMIIDKLRAETNTGFPDILAAASSLSKVAEPAWLRQVSSWLLYGKLPTHGARDFFIRTETSKDDGSTIFVKDKNLLPGFVTPAAANSILFVGKSLDQVKRYTRQAKVCSQSDSRVVDQSELASAHLAHLSALALPIQSAQLTRALIAIKLSLSQNVLKYLLPVEDTLRLFQCLRQYFLLGRGEFAVTLIDEAEKRLQTRQQSMGRLLQQDPLKALQGLSIRDTELHEALTQVWKILAREDEDGDDQILEFATKHATLAAPSKSASRPTSADSVSGSVPQISPVQFNDVLFPSAASLQIKIEPPLDLLVSAREIDTYSSINAYLFAIRRAQVRIAALWRRTAARRDHPSPSGRHGSIPSPDARLRMQQRTRSARKVWATCSAASFLVSETAAYFEGEIIRESCDHFEKWVTEPSTPTSGLDVSTISISTRQEEPDTPSQRDPETLATGHRSFLASLTYALLLTDIHYTRELRSLLGNLDSLIAFFTRLLDIQQKLDLETDAGGASAHTEEDEQRTALDLDRARKKVDSDLKSVVKRLRQLDHERIGSARYFDLGGVESAWFEPWKGGGVDRLLMKLEFGRLVEEGFDIV